MNKEEKAQYDFRAVRETMNESHHVHKEIAIELLNSLQKRHLELLEQVTPDTSDHICIKLREELPIYDLIPIRYDKETKAFCYHTNNKLLVNIARITKQGKLSVGFEISPSLFHKITKFYVNILRSDE